MLTGKTCTTKKDIPVEDHFVILEFYSIHIPGDERSRTCPGHGYPESIERAVRYIAFTDQLEWENDIKRRMQQGYSSPEKFIPLKVSGVTIKTTFDIKVS